MAASAVVGNMAAAALSPTPCLATNGTKTPIIGIVERTKMALSSSLLIAGQPNETVPLRDQ